jgi:flagella basal body P-ring formation protein FlgA
MDFTRGLIAALLAACAGAPAQAMDLQGLRQFLERETAGLPGHVELSVGTPDRRIDFSACTRAEPFVPAGARLWGRTWAGMRCLEGASLTAYVPVRVTVRGTALVAARSLAAGAAVVPADVRREEVELTREPPGALADLGLVEHKRLARPLAEGQTLRLEHFRALPAVSAGDVVKLLYAGAGFVVSGEGRAIGTAAEGQVVRVQTAGGKTLSGTARAGRVVQLGY